MEGLKQALSGKQNNTNKELSGTDQMARQLVGGTFSLRNSEFLSDVYNESKLTPHREMEKAETMRREHGFVQSEVELMTDAIMGRELSIEVADGKGDAKAYFQTKVLPKLKLPLREAVENLVVTGNGYVETVRQGGNPSGKILNFESIANSQDVYIDYTNLNQPDAYIQEMRRGEHQSYEVPYANQSNGVRSVTGIKYEPEEVIHLKMGTSHVPVYGRSGLASAINDGKILAEMKRDMAVISRYKSIPRFIVQIMNSDDTTVTDDEMGKVEGKFENADDFENIFLANKEIELKDMSYEVDAPSLNAIVQELKSNITASVPDFWMSGDVTNYAVAQEQKNVFYLRIMAIRDMVKPAINEKLEEIAKQRGYGDAEPEVVFGEFDFPTRKEKIEEARQLWNDGIITLNEARERIGLEPIPESDEGGIGDAFSFEVKSENPLAEMVAEEVESQTGDGIPDGDNSGEGEEDTGE